MTKYDASVSIPMFEFAPAPNAFNQAVKITLMCLVYPTCKAALIAQHPFGTEKSFSAHPAHGLVNKQTHIGMDGGMHLRMTLRCSGSANAIKKFPGPQKHFISANRGCTTRVRIVTTELVLCQNFVLWSGRQHKGSVVATDHIDAITR